MIETPNWPPSCFHIPVNHVITFLSGHPMLRAPNETTYTLINHDYSSTLGPEDLILSCSCRP